MTEKDILPQGANWLTPYLTVNNAENRLEFYEKAFGFEPRNTMPGKDGKIIHAEMSNKDLLVIMFARENAWGGQTKTPANSNMDSPIGLYIYCGDVDSLVNQAKDAGAEVLSEPEDMFWGDRIARLRVPDGYTWTFATKVGEFDLSKMPPM